MTTVVKRFFPGAWHLFGHRKHKWVKMEGSAFTKVRSMDDETILQRTKIWRSQDSSTPSG